MHKEVFTETASGGEIEEATVDLRGICRQIVVEPTTSTTSYTIKIEDANGYTVFETDTETGNYCELTNLPLIGVYTIKIESATADEEFVIQLIVEV